VPTVPLFRALVPIEHTMLLLVPALAACTVVGWWAGGRLVLAVAWIAIAGWMLATPVGGAGGYDSLARGWSVLLAASFGVVGLARAGRPFFSRALAACGITLALALLVLLFTAGSVGHLQDTMEAEFSRRVAQAIARWESLSRTPEWTEFARANPGAAQIAGQGQNQLRALPTVASLLVPALLLLESMAALGLAWGLYHRIARARLGPPMAQLREFRFNDQLVWGLIVGITVVAVPTLSPLRPVGVNFLLFFGVLYALRGLGVLTWFLAPGRLMTVVMIGFALFMWPLLSVFALGIGLGDTWIDWRSRPRPTT
jgi:hypothetical protein